MFPSIAELYDKGKEFLQWYRERQLKRTYEKTQAARLNPALPAYLATWHPYPILSRGGLTYPVTTVTCPPAQQGQPESVLGGLIEVDASDFFVNDPRYLDMLRRQGKRLYNGRTYSLRSVEHNGRITIHCQLGHYYDAMTTCDILEWELLNAIGDSTLTVADFPALNRKLPLRRKYAQRVKDPAFDGTGRSAAISISTLIVFNNGSSFNAFVRFRSSKTAAHADLYHVVPSFIFQPYSGHVKNEYSISHNVDREYLEEVFGAKEMESSAGEITFDWFYSHEKLDQLRHLMENGQAELLLTGYAVNLLNYRPEICTLLLIKDKDWCKQRIVANWEFLTPEESWEKGAEFMLPIDIMRADAEIGEELATFPGTFVPPGAAAFWLGVDLAKRRIGAA